MKKKKYDVYVKRIVEIEDPYEHTIEYDWEFAGTTYAVSEAKAINNVRFRNSLPSQHKPIETSGHYEVWVKWKAETEG